MSETWIYIIINISLSIINLIIFLKAKYKIKRINLFASVFCGAVAIFMIINLFFK